VKEDHRSFSFIIAFHKKRYYLFFFLFFQQQPKDRKVKKFSSRVHSFGPAAGVVYAAAAGSYQKEIVYV